MSWPNRIHGAHKRFQDQILLIQRVKIIENLTSEVAAADVLTVKNDFKIKGEKRHYWVQWPFLQYFHPIDHREEAKVSHRYFQRI